MHDLIIRGASIVDGSGAPARSGDVAIDGDRISAVNGLRASRAKRTLNADGLVLAPGFIDLHAHSDLVLLEHPGHELKVRMGVTTELLGQDGLSYAPITRDAMSQMRDLVAPINGVPDIEYDWRSVAQYLDRVSAAAPAVNVAYLVPHGALRLSVMGMANRIATDPEAARMAAMAAEGMADGAVGLSTGLTYPPTQWSDTSEIVTIARAIAPFAGIYVTHHRDYGAGLKDSVAEALAIGQRAEIAVHFSHFYASGLPWKGRAAEVLALLRSARERGQDVTLDAYPYLAASTFLGAFIPESLQAGGPAEIVAQLEDPTIRAGIEAQLNRGPRQYVQASWDQFVISGVSNHVDDEIVGQRIPEIAAARGLSIGAFICDLLVAQRMNVSITAHFGNEENVRTIMADPGYCVGTDGIMVGESFHPRAGGTYPRILGVYVREQGVLTLERAIRAMSGAPADRLGLVDRGYVRAGAKADLVLFDPLTVDGPASYEQPRLAPVGMPFVFVNGQPVKWNDELTGARPGEVLRGHGKGRVG